MVQKINQNFDLRRQTNHTHRENNFGLPLMPNTDLYQNLIIMGIALNYDHLENLVASTNKS